MKLGVGEQNSNPSEWVVAMEENNDAWMPSIFMALGYDRRLRSEGMPLLVIPSTGMACMSVISSYTLDLSSASPQTTLQSCNHFMTCRYADNAGNTFRNNKSTLGYWSCPDVQAQVRSHVSFHGTPRAANISFSVLDAIIMPIHQSVPTDIH